MGVGVRNPVCVRGFWETWGGGSGKKCLVSRGAPEEDSRGGLWPTVPPNLGIVPSEQPGSVREHMVCHAFQKFYSGTPPPCLGR